MRIDPTSPQADFHTPRYLRNNFRRMEHLATLGLDLRAKRVLEVGAGIGDLTTFFLDRACRVHATEGRGGNLALLRERYADDPAVTVSELNLDPPPSDWPHDKAQVVFCYGLLYHLSDPLAALDFLSAQCTELLLLETIVSFGSHEAINPWKEDGALAGSAVSGMGCRPTRPWVFARLKERFPYVAMPVTQPCHAEFPLDWTAAGHPCAARAIFVASRNHLENPLLMTEPPSRQRAI